MDDIRLRKNAASLTILLCLLGSPILACVGSGTGTAATEECNTKWEQSTASSTCDVRSITGTGTDSNSGENQCYIEVSCEFQSTDAAGNQITVTNSSGGEYVCPDIPNLKNCDGKLEVGSCS